MTIKGENQQHFTRQRMQGPLRAAPTHIRGVVGRSPCEWSHTRKNGPWCDEATTLLVEILARDLEDHRREQQQADEVGHRHQPVQGVREIPDEGHLHVGETERRQHPQAPVDHEAVLAEEILPAPLAVVRPAQDGREGEDRQRDGDDVAPARDGALKTRRGEQDARQARAVRALQHPRAGSEDDQRRHRADHDGVDEGAQHGDDALAHRAVRLRRRVRDGRRAQARFVREHAARDAEANRRSHSRARETTRRSRRREGVGEDERDGPWDLGDVDEDDDERSAHVEGYHGRYELARHLTDSLDAAQDDEAHQRGHDDARQPRGNPKTALQRGRHRVHLHGVPDAEGRHGAEHGEREPQPLGEFGREFTHAVSQVIHGAAHVLARPVHLAVGDRADGFRVFRRHAEERDEPHVEDGSRSPQGDGGGDAGDVPGADGCGERRHQRVEGFDLALADGVVLVVQELEAVAHLAPGHEHQPQREQHARHAQHPQHRRTPGEGVHGIDHGI